jgi:hypothetical protein
MKGKKMAAVGGILLGVGGLLALLGGLYQGSPPLWGAAGEQTGTERPVYQFRAHFISFLPRESEHWVGDYAQDPLHQPIFIALGHRLNRDLYNVRSPRGGWRYRSLAEVLAEGGLKPDAAALRSPDPAVVEEELNRLDERFRFQVTATLEGQAPLGELMVGHARTKPVALEQAGQPLGDPEAQVVYDVSLTMRIEKVYEDGYALMHYSRMLAGRKEARQAKVPLHEIKLGEARTIGGFSPIEVGDFSLYTSGSNLGEVVVPGHLLLATVSPIDTTGQGK